ncbi:transposase [Chlorobaculum sp. 24CR]|uniref:REP-associated tyrosine transposase n=1 Tax=Chlorobaculum sp. 24CR TaxID=2508878 RepID=UPI001ADD19B9|nr:transposase [Chlorobaculum sp. 24CR]
METNAKGTFAGWYSRGYLPHFDSGEVVQSVTFRLADSLPRAALRVLEERLADMPKTEAERERRASIEQWLDAGMGCCVLQHPEIAVLVQDNLLRFDGERYRLFAWCIMPNHVHLLLEPLISLATIVQRLKSWTARVCNAKAAEFGLAVPDHGFWMREYWDRFIRNEEHFYQAIWYIHENPVNAGLCTVPEEWRWSSARERYPWERRAGAPRGKKNIQQDAVPTGGDGAPR